MYDFLTSFERLMYVKFTSFVYGNVCIQVQDKIYEDIFIYMYKIFWTVGLTNRSQQTL